MKEILESLINKEEELKNHYAEVQTEAEAIVQSAKHKIGTMEKDFEDKFNRDRDASYNEVTRKAAEFESGLRVKMRVDMDQKKQKLAQQSAEIKAKVAKAILEE